MRLRQILFLPPALLALLAILGSFAGAWHGLGDSLAVIRLPLCALAAVLLLAAGRPLWLFRLGLAATIGVAAPLVWAMWVEGEAGPVTVYQKNLSFRTADPGPVIADICARAPDVVTLQEAPPALRDPILEALAEEWPARHACPLRGVGGPVVLSRWPMVPGSARCAGPRGTALMQVEAPQGALWVGSLHLHWPWPHGQKTQLEALLPELAALEGPVILGGDFNMVPWGDAVQAIVQATGTRRAGKVAATFWLDDWLPLPIDHVLAPGGGRMELLPELGSDHLGVLARVSIAAP